MRGLIVLIVFLLSFFPELRTQNLSLTWGEISDVEFQESSFDADPASNALILFDLGHTSFRMKEDTSFRVVFIHTRRVKILKEGGKVYGNYEIRIYPWEKITRIEAITYEKRDGKIYKNFVSKDAFFTVDRGKGLKSYRIAIPKVKVGSVIEFRYVKESSILSRLPSWSFQQKLPVLYSQVEVGLLPLFDYTFRTQFIENFEKQEIRQSSRELVFGDSIYKEKIYLFQKSNIPAFEELPYINSFKDYVMRIDFQLSKVHPYIGPDVPVLRDWPAIIDFLAYEEGFGKYLDKAGKFADRILRDEAKFLTPSKAKSAEKIIDFVKTSFRWDSIYSFNSWQSPKEFYETKVGNSAEINLFLIAMLRSAGIEAEAVVLSTKENGKIKVDHPFLDFFNHVIVLVKIGKQAFLADASEKLLPFNLIPPNCRNGQGLLIQKAKPLNWVNLATKVQSVSKHDLRIDIDPDTYQHHIATNSMRMGYPAYDFRVIYKKTDGEMEEEELVDYVDEGEIQVFNQSNPKAPFIMQIKGVMEPGFAENNMIIDPFLGFSLRKNLLYEDSREIPVEFDYPFEEQYSITLSVPIDFRIESIPESFSEDSEIGTLLIESEKIEGFIHIRARFSIKKSIYLPNEYADLKDFFDRVIRFFNQKIVLEALRD